MLLTALRPFAPYIIGGLLVSHAGVYLVGRSHGAEAEKRAEAKRLAKAQKAVAKREKKADAITEKVADKLSEERIRIEYRTRYLTKEVIRYVPAEADAACTVPVGFVRLHDAAASGGEAEVPAGAGGSVEAPSGVSLSAVAETVVWNYGAAQQWRAEALGWREWYQRQLENWGR